MVTIQHVHRFYLLDSADEVNQLIQSSPRLTFEIQANSQKFKTTMQKRLMKKQITNLFLRL